MSSPSDGIATEGIAADGLAAGETLSAHIVVPRPDFDVDVEFEVARGEVLTLLGPNGSGKSTVLTALVGVEPAAEGTITFGDETWANGASRVPSGDRRVGWVPQSGQVFGHMSVLDNVAFGLRARGRSRQQARGRAAELLETAGLEGLSRRKARTLSGGQARRVAVLRALASTPRLLLLDEPTGGLDTRARADLQAWLAGWLTSARTPVVLATHDPVLAETFGRDSLRLSDGRSTPRTDSVHEVDL